MIASLSSVALARLVTGVFSVALVVGVMGFHPGCVNLVVWASFEKSDLLGEIAARYEQTRPSEDLRCVHVVVERKASGDAEEALTHVALGQPPNAPDVWSPAASTWLSLLDRHRARAGVPTIGPSSAPSILQSPLVIAMPKPMAEVLGWPRASISWKDIFALAQDAQGWAARGHPEWGRFKLAKTNPLISTSGLHVLLATAHTSGLQPTDEAALVAFLRGIEGSVVHYGSTVSAFLVNLAEADDRDEALTYVSAIAMEEKQVWDYNNGNPEFRPAPTRLSPKIPLVAVYPSEGTLVADHPYAVMPWVAVDEQKRRAAAHFLDHLKSEDVQREFMNNAFRGARGETGATIRTSPELDASAPSILFALPDPKSIEQIQSSWKTFRKRARVLLLIDTGRSMGDRVSLGSKSKLELAKDAWTSVLDAFAFDDDVGLSKLAGKDRSALVPPGPLRDQRGQLEAEIARLEAQGTGRALYSAIAEAVTSVRQRFARDRINAVVVLTDGRNDDPTNNDLNGLLRTLRAQSEDERVRVFTIAYGSGADRDALARIAHASRGVFYEASDPSVINRVVLDVVSNF